VPNGGWGSVAYGDGVWIAAPAGYNVTNLLRSTDGGASWATVTVPGSNIWTGIEYGDGVWVAVGINEKVLHSTNTGLNWTETDPPDFGIYYNSVAYGDGAWVTVGGSMGYRGIMYSGSLELTVPGPPTNVTGATGDSQATVSWNGPANNGGTDITAYTVTADPGGATCSTASTSCTVTGLTNGTAYTFTVVATNTTGNSSASAASAPVTAGGLANPNVWTLIDASYEDHHYYGVGYGDHVFIGVSAQGNAVGKTIRSTDGGQTWTNINDGIAAAGWSAVAYGNGVWVAVGCRSHGYSGICFYGSGLNQAGITVHSRRNIHR